jgi:FkbM family methyltransferase
MKVINGHTEYNYRGYTIKSPAEGTGSFFEIFYDQVYNCELNPNKDDVVIDVGAYVGMWTVRSAIDVGSKGKVIAIEPSKYNNKWLSDNVKYLDNVTCYKGLASNKDGFETLWMNKASSCNSTILKQGNPVKTQCKKLDTIAKELNIKINFIKIDAEGAELKVLEGAEEILKGNVKLSIVSYHDLSDGHPEYTVIEKFLTDRGYKVKNDSGVRRYIYAQKA